MKGRRAQKDIDPRIFEAVILVARTGCEFKHAAKQIFGTEEKESVVKYRFWRLASRPSIDRKAPLPSACIKFCETDGYQLCSACGTVIPPYPGSPNPDDDRPLALQLIAGKQTLDGRRTKFVLKFLCAKCTIDHKRKWPAVWKKLAAGEMLFYEAAAAFPPFDKIDPVLPTLWDQLLNWPIRPRSICGDCEQEFWKNRKPVEYAEACPTCQRLPFDARIWLGFKFPHFSNHSFISLPAWEVRGVFAGKDHTIVSWGKPEWYKAQAKTIEFWPKDKEGNSPERLCDEYGLDRAAQADMAYGNARTKGAANTTPDESDTAWGDAEDAGPAYVPRLPREFLFKNLVEDEMIAAIHAAREGRGRWPSAVVREQLNIRCEERHQPLPNYEPNKATDRPLSRRAFVAPQSERDALLKAYIKGTGAFYSAYDPGRDKHKRVQGHFVCGKDTNGRPGWVPLYSARKPWGPPGFRSIRGEILEYFYSVGNLWRDDYQFLQPGKAKGERPLKSLKRDILLMRDKEYSRDALLYPTAYRDLGASVGGIRLLSPKPIPWPLPWPFKSQEESTLGLKSSKIRLHIVRRKSDPRRFSNNFYKEPDTLLMWRAPKRKRWLFLVSVENWLAQRAKKRGRRAAFGEPTWRTVQASAGLYAAMAECEALQSLRCAVGKRGGAWALWICPACHEYFEFGPFGPYLSGSSAELAKKRILTGIGRHVLERPFCTSGLCR